MRLTVPLLIVVLLSGSVRVLAADEAKPAAAVIEKTAPIDPSKFKSADEFWSFVQKQNEEPQAPLGTSPEDALALFKAWQQRRKEAAEAFAKAYPNDPRRWDAKLMATMAGLEAQKFDQNANDDRSGLDKVIEEVLAAPDATAEATGEAHYFKSLRVAAALDSSNPYPDIARGLTDFIERYPDHHRSRKGVQLVTQMIEAFGVPDSDKLLARLSQSSNKDIADTAKNFVAEQEASKQMKSEPVELSFKATNGQGVDVAKMRGKVVLLDFWASWCGPCVQEMPNVVKTFKELHDQGFEVIGISLDDDQQEMEAAMKKLNMTWPQYFEGGAGKNKIADRFGIMALPAAWLLDKSNKVRGTGLRGEALAEAVKKLLAETQDENATPASANTTKGSANTGTASKTDAVKASEDSATTADAFMRVIEDEKSMKLQAAVTRYKKDGVSVEIIADIHMADEAYFKARKTRLASYDAVLFEMIGGDNAKADAVSKGSQTPGEKAPKVAGLYGDAAKKLGLTDGQAFEDLTASNMIPGDLTNEEFARLLAQRGESLLDIFKKAVQGDGSPERAAARARSAKAEKSGDPNLMKLEILQTFGHPGSMLGSYSGAGAAISERNQRCFEVLSRELAAGKKNLAIIYGSVHLPEMERRLLAMGFKQVQQEWLTAWDVPKTSKESSNAGR